MKLKSSESAEQEVVVEWASWHTARYPCLKWLHHVPNGGYRNKAEGARLKNQGVTPGISDLHLPYPNNGYHGLYIEMKYGKNKPTNDQKEFLKYAKEQGYAVALCYNAAEAIAVIKRYLKG